MLVTEEYHSDHFVVKRDGKRCAAISVPDAGSHV